MHVNIEIIAKTAFNACSAYMIATGQSEVQESWDDLSTDDKEPIIADVTDLLHGIDPEEHGRPSIDPIRDAIVKSIVESLRG